MSEFGDSAVKAIGESAGKSALEAKNKLSAEFIEASKKVAPEQQDAFRQEMDTNLKNVLPSLSIVSFEKDEFVKKYDSNHDGAVSDKEMKEAIANPNTPQADKLMLESLAKQYEALKNQNQQDGKDNKNADGITSKDIQTYLSRNASDKPLVAEDGSITRDYGTFKQTVLKGGAVVTTNSDGNTTELEIPGKLHLVKEGDKWVSIDGAGNKTEAKVEKIEVSNGTVFVTRDGGCKDEYRADGTVIKKDPEGKITDLVIPGQIDIHKEGDKWVDKNHNPINVTDCSVDEAGNITVKHDDNSATVYKPDGSIEIHKSDGTVVNVDADSAKSTAADKDKIQEASRIKSGEGPYASAKRMLEAAGVTGMTPKEILQFARWLRDHVAKKQSFTTKDKLAEDKDWPAVADKINEIKASHKKKQEQ